MAKKVIPVKVKDALKDLEDIKAYYDFTVGMVVGAEKYDVAQTLKDIEKIEDACECVRLAISEWLEEIEED